MRILCVFALLAALAGCASATAIPDADRARLETELTGKSRFLRISLYQGPFWSDDSRQLVTPGPPQELVLFTDASGRDQPAPPSTGIVPAGRKVTITQVELPSGLVVAGRLPYSPRYNPWVYLTIEGDKSGKPSILVIRSDLKSHDQFLQALDRILSVDDPAPRLNAYPEDVRQAIAQKQLVRDMDSAAVEMSWGIPEHKHIDLSTHLEDWTYSGGKRTVELVNDKVVKFETAAAVPAPAP